jgi:hypothetical protein
MLFQHLGEVKSKLFLKIMITIIIFKHAAILIKEVNSKQQIQEI